MTTLCLINAFPPDATVPCVTLASSKKHSRPNSFDNFLTGGRLDEFPGLAQNG